MPFQGCQQSQIIILLQPASCWCHSYCWFPKSYPITFLSYETHLHYRAASWLVHSGRVREGILGAPSLVGSGVSQRWHAKGTSESPVCPLLASCKTASFTMENGFFFQWCHAIPKNKNKESCSEAQYIYQHWQHCLLHTSELMNINSFHASALSN
jgi:hypothetical protein